MYIFILYIYIMYVICIFLSLSLSTYLSIYIYIYMYIYIYICIYIYIYALYDRLACASSWLRTNGVNTNGASAKVMNFVRLGEKARPGTFGKTNA